MEEEKLVDEPFNEADVRLKEEYDKTIYEVKKRMDEIKRQYVEKLSKI